MDGFSSPDGDEANIPPTIYVMKFHENARREAVEFLLEKIEAKHKFGGAELYVRCEPPGEGLTVHITATKIKLLEIAEAIEIQKPTQDGIMQEVSVRGLDNFLHHGATLDTLLSPGEIEYCVRRELHAMSAGEEPCLPGYPGVPLQPDDSLVDVYKREAIITSLFPLHDRQKLKEVYNKCVTTIIPYNSEDELRNYFGEGIALYFSFLGLYTMMLVLPAVLGLLQTVLGLESFAEHTFYAAFNLVYVTIFLEMWKRQCSTLSYQWGTLGSEHKEQVRQAYRTEQKRQDAQPHSCWKTNIKIYLVSVPAVGVSVLLALYVMVTAFTFEERVLDWSRFYGAFIASLMPVPTSLYAMIVWLMNFYYKKLATFLTNWENHRTQYDHEWHRMSKLVTFAFVNNFSSLFYIAFYIQDMAMLRSHVATMLIVWQMINHFQETLLPYFIRKAYSKIESSVIKQLKEHPATSEFFAPSKTAVEDDAKETRPVPVLSLCDKDPRITQAREEIKLDSYADTYDDYLEIFTQFSYVFLFSSVYPMAAFWALLNNVLELKTDAFKICQVYQRPPSARAANIGVWQGCFELVGWLAVGTNCALLCVSPHLSHLAKAIGWTSWVLVFVGLEHLILLTKTAIAWLVPDRPSTVREAVDRANTLTKLAAKADREKRIGRMKRRFRSVHGMPRSGSRSRGASPNTSRGESPEMGNGGPARNRFR